VGKATQSPASRAGQRHRRSRRSLLQPPMVAAALSAATAAAAAASAAAACSRRDGGARALPFPLAAAGRGGAKVDQRHPRVFWVGQEVEGGSVPAPKPVITAGWGTGATSGRRECLAELDDADDEGWGTHWEIVVTPSLSARGLTLHLARPLRGRRLGPGGGGGQADGARTGIGGGTMMAGGHVLAAVRDIWRRMKCEKGICLYCSQWLGPRCCSSYGCTTQGSYRLGQRTGKASGGAAPQLCTGKTPPSTNGASQNLPIVATSDRHDASDSTPTRNTQVRQCGHAPPRKHPRAGSIRPPALAAIHHQTSRTPFEVGRHLVCLVDEWQPPRSHGKECGNNNVSSITSVLRPTVAKQ